MKPSQLSFESLLADANSANVARQLDKEYGQLPATMDEAMPFYRELIQRHHEAMLAGDAAKVRSLREEAGKLAYKLNNYQSGIIADDDSLGSVLARLSAAERDTIPLWGQVGSFEIRHGKMRVRIEIEGLYGRPICLGSASRRVPSSATSLSSATLATGVSSASAERSRPVTPLPTSRKGSSALT